MFADNVGRICLSELTFYDIMSFREEDLDLLLENIMYKLEENGGHIE